MAAKCLGHPDLVFFCLTFNLKKHIKIRFNKADINQNLLVYFNKNYWQCSQCIQHFALFSPEIPLTTMFWSVWQDIQQPSASFFPLFIVLSWKCVTIKNAIVMYRLIGECRQWKVGKHIIVIQTLWGLWRKYCVKKFQIFSARSLQQFVSSRKFHLVLNSGFQTSTRFPCK